jgi:hypothetical protein
MELAYTIIRINQDLSTVTVMLKVGEKTLQQDVEVKDFDNVAQIQEDIVQHVYKLADDVQVAAKSEKPVKPALENLLDHEVSVEAR